MATRRNGRAQEEAEEEPRAGDLQVHPFTIQELMAATMGDRAPRERRKPVKPPKWEEKQDMGEYLQLFSTIADHNEWDDVEAAIQLRCSLTGSPQLTAFSYPDYHFRDLRNELLNRYGIEPKDARFEIRRLKRERGVTPEQLADEIRRLVRLGNGHRMTPEQINEEEIEVFLDTLDWPDLAMLIMANQPATLRDAVRVAKTHQGFRNRTRANQGRTTLRQLEVEGEEPEVAKPDPVTESIRLLTSELSQLKTKLDQATTEKIACYICSGEHYASGCPQRRPRTHKNGKTNNKRGDNSSRQTTQKDKQQSEN